MTIVSAHMRRSFVIAVLVAAATGCTNHTEQSPLFSPSSPFMSPNSPSSPSPAGLTLHTDRAPSKGVDAGQELFSLLQQKACPDDTEQNGFSLGVQLKDRTKSSWTAIVKCDDGSKHTVLVVWD
jgi:hypothetical protein